MDINVLVGFIVLEAVGFLFIKFWGKKVIPTFISGIVFVLAISNYRLVYGDNDFSNFILQFISTTSLFVLIILSLKRYKLVTDESGLLIFKDKKIYFSIIVCFILGIISYLINKTKDSALTIGMAKNLFLSFLFLPFLFELFVHEVIWKLISLKKNRILKGIFYVLITGILIWLSCADWEYSVLMLINALVTLIGAGVYRFFFKNPSEIWVCILIRGIFYFIMFSFC